MSEQAHPQEESSLLQICRRYERFVDVVEEEKLWNADSLKPLLDGRALMTALGTSRGGSHLKTALDEEVSFQFDNPAAQIEDVKSWVVQHRAKWLSNET